MADSREVRTKRIEAVYSNTTDEYLPQEKAWLDVFHKIMATPLVKDTTQFNKKLFYSFFEPFLGYSQFSLINVINTSGSIQVDKKSLCASWAEELYTKLFNLSVRTLIQELHIARLSGVLIGATSEERYHYYNDVILRDNQYMESLFGMYPVLAKLMVEATEKFINFNTEIIVHLNVDIDQVRHYFQSDFKKLESISTGIGDTHHKGRSVSILKFNERDKLIYKPRSMKIDCAFEQFIAWVNKKVEKIEYQTTLSIDKFTYGWQVYLEPIPCKTKKEIARYYYRYGGFIALLYVLNSRDFHFENIIAYGEYPILIDLETLFSNSIEIESENESFNLFRYEMDHSVYSSLLIPYKLTPEEDTDKSGLGQWGDTENEILSQVIEAPFTDVMKLIKKKVPSKGSSNKPQLINQSENYVQYITHIEAGFTEIYFLMMLHFKELTDLGGPLQAFMQAQVRHIFRPTNDYAEFLQSSLHPDYLQKMSSRIELFNHLQKSASIAPYFKRIVPYEMESLLRQEIPVFTFTFEGDTIQYSDGRSTELTFSSTSYQRVKDQCEKLTHNDYEKQRRYLKMSLTSSVFYEDVEFLLQNPQPVSDDLYSKHIIDGEFLDSALRIGDELIMQAAWDQNQKNIVWIDRKSSGNKNNYIGMLEPTLYNGSLGIILFLAHLGQESGERKYRDFAEQALKTSISSMTEIQTGSLSPFYGLMSVAYTLLHLAALWNDEQMFEEAKVFMGQIEPLINQDKELDIVGGSAGAIILLMNVYSQTSDAHIMHLACKCGDHLLLELKDRLAKEEELLSGLSHGLSGYAWAFIELWSATKNEQYLRFAELLIDMERNDYNKIHNNWRDKRLDEDFAFQSVFWCHGAPGIALSRVKMLLRVTDAEMINEVENGISKIWSDGLRYAPFLCHGSWGNIDILLSIRQTMDSLDKQQTGLEYLATQIGSNYKNISSMDYPLGMMTGISGYGYGLLRLNNNRLPSILALEIPSLKLFANK